MPKFHAYDQVAPVDGGETVEVAANLGACRDLIDVACQCQKPAFCFYRADGSYGIAHEGDYTLIRRPDTGLYCKVGYSGPGGFFEWTPVRRAAGEADVDQEGNRRVFVQFVSARYPGGVSNPTRVHESLLTVRPPESYRTDVLAPFGR